MILLRDGGQNTLGKDLLASTERLRSFDPVSAFRISISPILVLLRPLCVRPVQALVIPAQSFVNGHGHAMSALVRWAVGSVTFLGGRELQGDETAVDEFFLVVA
jgi:hypothetical protein